MSISELFGISNTNINQVKSNDSVNTQTNQNGLDIPVVSSASRNGLPYSNTPNGRGGNQVRKIIHFLVPEVGVVKLFVNPESINYNFKKLIDRQRTKGGYVLQYWGEDLTDISIGGTTGSSGIEGINVLLEVYRAEQYVFDNLGLTIDSLNSISSLNNFITDNLFNASATNFLGNFLNPTQSSQAILPKTIPSLASLAFGLELYYDGWVFRGYISNITVSERSDNVGLFNYSMNFTATQRRGYRTNSFPWQHSAKDGPSDWDTSPLSFGQKPKFPTEQQSLSSIRKEEIKIGRRTAFPSASGLSQNKLK